jgi:hypothetical protein
MFLDKDLINHVQTKNGINVESLIIAEWNQNSLSNIENYGNYRWRPESQIFSDIKYRSLIPEYDYDDTLDAYRDALESNSISKYRTENSEDPLAFLTPETNMQLYYSLIDCFKPFRPRSGINKMLFFSGNYIDSIRSARRPRYYFCSRRDEFKYWTSFRKEDDTLFGISSLSPKYSTDVNIGYQINDAVPFVVYKNSVASNRIVVKMQTNLSDPDGLTISRESIVPQSIRIANKIIIDPLKDESKSSIPKRWKIQYLDSKNNWNDAASFDETSTRKDGSRIVPWDGYVELAYGVKVPEEYRDSFNFIDYVSSSVQFLDNPINGEAYITESSSSEPGTLNIWDSLSLKWNTFPAEYGFSLSEDSDTKKIGLVKKFNNPDYFIKNGAVTFRDIEFVKGLRVVVETMYAPNKTFDLIEMSPRLRADITKYTVDYEINKNMMATDFGLPVGGLVASTGNINISNHDGSFTELNYFNTSTNTGSIIANSLNPQIKFDFYETILNVDGYNKFVPLKTFYSENSLVSSSSLQDIGLDLRDAFFRLETKNATSLFLQNCTLTMAVATMLDNIGFSNYIFKGISTANDPVIPFFFVEPDISVAEVLQRLAQSTQTSMFFDEYNNFVVMPKEYLMPDSSVRDSNDAISERLITLYGQKTTVGGIDYVPNIEAVSSSETKIINDGQINYTTRYIQREISKLEQAELDLSERTYAYKSSLLWELGDQEELRTINQPLGRKGYSLAAVPLNDDLSDVVPYVSNHNIVNNIIDVGENSIWISRFQGYFFANGEIIRYDAQEYDVSGVGRVWISDNSEYQKYFSKLPFNGKMILTGNIRIFVEPFYENAPGLDIDGLDSGVRYKNGEVKSHGRGQFGTEIFYHSSGINDYWKNSSNIQSFRMNSNFLFDTRNVEDIPHPEMSQTKSGKLGEDKINLPTISDKIANFLKQSVRSENNSSVSSQGSIGTIQSSSLVMSGAYPIQSSGTDYASKDLVSYVYKDFSNDFKHVGTRLRIIGKSIDKDNQSPLNSTSYYTVTNSTSDTTSEISGGSGGIGYMVDTETNSGYYLELAALSKDFLESTTSANSASVGGEVHNILFYKVLPTTTQVQDDKKPNVAIPVKLWGTTAKILVDEGKFVGMDRMASIDNQTVYDIGIESEIIPNSNIAKFYIYLNNVLIATVIDTDALPSIRSDVKFTTCLFVRGSSKAMFEHLYALKNKASQTESVTVSSGLDLNNNPVTKNLKLSSIQQDLSIAESLRSYALPYLVESSYLSSIGAERSPELDIYYEEFGTILRECAYFNIKYDQAYPAIVAQLVPSFTDEKSYTVSGFLPGSYGAEFLLFNNTDKAINLSESSTNRIMIQGITFTQNISNVLTLDDYFKEMSNFSDPVVSNNTIVNPERAEKVYDDIKTSRSIYGSKAFSLDSFYIQNEDSAKDIMKWLIGKTLKPRKVLEIDVFGIPYVQLGDIVKIDYDLQNGIKFVDVSKRFVVISMLYSRSSSDIKTAIRMVEV